MNARPRRGLAASSGVAVGRALVWGDPESGVVGGDPVRVLAAVAEELGRTAERLRADGRSHEAEILEANRMMAEDPTLIADVEGLAQHRSAGEALRSATQAHADALAALGDPVLAARATDVRQLGSRAIRILEGTGAPLASVPSILVARDLGPADVAELQLGRGSIEGIALAEGAVTSHAAIIARSLGVPMVVALGEDILELSRGSTLVLDGDNGTLEVDPDHVRLAQAKRRLEWDRRRKDELSAQRALPAVTTDGRAVTLLCNASTPDEVALGIAAGADGVGLLRTELAFLDSAAWPTERDHLTALAPVLGLLEGRTATVRTLDFGADKTPRFLEETSERGLALMLARPDSLAAQLRAIVASGEKSSLRILLPLVEDAEQVRDVRALLDSSVPLGAMIETPSAVRRAEAIAEAADFLSVGTNDLVQYTLGLDRLRPLASTTTAADPEVLALIAETVRAARAAGRTIEVCGEAASDPAFAVLLVGLGVDELSAAPARLDELRATIRGISAADAAQAARSALAASTAEGALAPARELLLGELRDETGEVVGGLGRIGT
jgi:phosphoenolpyruvate-protein kinase (PTS system EI component)